jgi:alkylation response protein AidB-like acyl-CoA dehydrogenase
MTVPESHGGLGFWRMGGRFVPYYRVIETIARADSSTAQLLQVHCHATGMIAGLGNDAQRDFYMSEVVRDGRLIASCGSEAALGSTESGAKAELARAGDDYRLNARKAFASLAPAADYLNIWAAVEGDGPFHSRMVLVAVPRGIPGLELIDDWDTLGMRPTVSWSLQLTDVQVKPEWIIGQPGDWALRDPRTFTLAFAANHLGAAQAAYDFTRDYAAARPALAGSEIVQARLGDLSSKLYALRQAVYAAAAHWERGDTVNQAELDSIRALHLAKQVALEVTSEAYDICGARAAFNVYPLNQYLRDVRAFTLHFRDDAYMALLGRAELGQQFNAKAERYGIHEHAFSPQASP